MDDIRLKKGHQFDKDFFQRQLQKIREIRANLWLIPSCLSFRNRQTDEGRDREMPDYNHGEWRGSNGLA